MTNYVIGPDMTRDHIVGTVKMPGGTFETMIWRRDEPTSTVDEVQNDSWEEAMIAHAVIWNACSNLEKKGRVWEYSDWRTIRGTK